jgi:hypothetical protein
MFSRRGKLAEAHGEQARRLNVMPREFPVKNRNRRGRAVEASAQDAFERALRGEGFSRRRGGNEGGDRKTLQLCRQVQRALMLADVAVESVEPMDGTAGQLLVRVSISAEDGSAAEALAKLHERTPMLRAAVARSICRKRVPGLTFIMVAREGGNHGN